MSSEIQLECDMEDIPELFNSEVLDYTIYIHTIHFNSKAEL